MDFNKLRTFLIVAEEGSVTAAAQRLLRTQPAVSQSLRALEEDLGITLLHRRKGRIYLTPEGEAIFGIASRSLLAAEEAILEIATNRDAAKGLIAVAVIANFGSQFVIDSLAPFRRQFPRVEFNVDYVARSALAEEKLLKNEVGLAISGHFFDRKRLDIYHLAVQRHTLVCSPDFLARAEPISTVRDVAASTALIDFSADFIALRSWLKANGHANASALKSKRPAFVIQDQADAKEAVLRGVGMAVLPDRLVRDSLDRVLMTEVLRRAKPVEVEFKLAMRKRRTAKFIIDRYLQYLQSGRQSPPRTASH